MLEGMSPTYEMGQAFGVVLALLGYTVFIVVPYAILFTWMYNNTKGSLLLAFVFHASQAWFALFHPVAERLVGYTCSWSSVFVWHPLFDILAQDFQDFGVEFTWPTNFRHEQGSWKAI